MTLAFEPLCAARHGHDAPGKPLQAPAEWALCFGGLYWQFLRGRSLLSLLYAVLWGPSAGAGRLSLPCRKLGHEQSDDAAARPPAAAGILAAGVESLEPKRHCAGLSGSQSGWAHGPVRRYRLLQKGCRKAEHQALGASLGAKVKQHQTKSIKIIMKKHANRWRQALWDPSTPENGVR